jgi:hypothetical protein
MPQTFRRVMLVLSLVGTTVGITACNSLLAVENPGRVTADALSDPALAPILQAAALQSAQCAFNNFAATNGMLSGEYWSANGFVNNHPWEWRGIIEIQNEPGSCVGSRTATSMGYYTPMQQARFQLEDQFKRLSSFTDQQVPNRQRMLAETLIYTGYMYTLLAETMCQLTFDGGPLVTAKEAWTIAEKRFTDGMTIATTINEASLLNMARVGRARTRLDMGNATGAATDAALVPAGYTRVAEFSEQTPSRENRFFNLTIRNDYLSVAPAYQGLTVNGTPDPRVRLVNANRRGADNVTQIWQQQKFTGSGAASQVIASYAEAQLILAESSTGQSALDAINRVRAISSIAPLTSIPAGETLLSVIIEERRRQLFSEGHRYVDMLRFKIPFPSGVNRKGQTYSSMTCIPLPFVETRNNPNLKGG